MLQKLNEHIAACYDRAADCRRRAGQATDAATKSELLDLERSWTRLAQGYEFVETLERFLLSARNDPSRGALQMTQPTPIKTRQRSDPQCSNCGGAMRLFGIEAHPTVERADLLTYVCPCCDEVQTEIVPLPNNKVVPFRRTTVDELAVNEAFDTETTHLLGTAFDSAWKSARTSGALGFDEPGSPATSESLARYIIAMVRRGERNPDRLVEKALRHLAETK
jgi:hypothetical protein